MSGSSLPRYKLVIVGDSSCGKTSLVSKWTTGSLIRSSPTINCVSETLTLDLPDHGRAYLSVWDTAGQEQFRSLAPAVCRASHLAILVTSVSDFHSFESIPEWRRIISSACDMPPPVVLVVNKMDLVESAVLTVEEIHCRYEGEFRALFFTSALSGENVKELFAFAGIEAAKFASRIIGPGMPPVVMDEDHKNRQWERGCCNAT
jgi:small GTP-binding protein